MHNIENHSILLSFNFCTSAEKHFEGDYPVPEYGCLQLFFLSLYVGHCKAWKSKNLQEI